MRRLISLSAVLGALAAMSAPAFAVHRDLPVGSVDAGGGSQTIITTPGTSFWTIQGSGVNHGFRCSMITDPPMCVGTPPRD